MTFEGRVIRETPLTIEQPFGQLFGILAEPTVPYPSAPCLVMLNAGATRHIGPNRMWVEICRHWAAQGIPTLRLDLEGIGDSDGDAARITRLYPSVMYTQVRTGQALAAVDMLEQRGVADRFILAGLCSGGFWSFHAADGDERVTAAFLINPRMLFWDRLIEPERDTRMKVLRTSGWPRVLRGEVPLRRGHIPRGPRAVHHAAASAPKQESPPCPQRPTRRSAGSAARPRQERSVLLLRRRAAAGKSWKSRGAWITSSRGRMCCVHYLPGSVHTLRPFVTQVTATDALNKAIGDELQRLAQVEDIALVKSS